MIPQDLEATLFQALVDRNIEGGKALINSNAALLHAVDPGHPAAPFLFHVMAGWAEYSPTACKVAQRLNSAYGEKGWPALTGYDWCYIETAKASLALYEGREEDLLASFKWITDNASRLDPCHEVRGTAAFVYARLHKKRANYLEGYNLIHSAISHYQQAGLPGMVAAAKVTQSWLLMQLGRQQEANQGWEESAEYLAEKADYTLRANILFAKGRRLCRIDQEVEARKFFEQAAALYIQCKPPHRNIRRVFIELANLLHRQVRRENDPKTLSELRRQAAYYVQSAAECLKEEVIDARNQVRLLHAQTNLALYGQPASIFNARTLAREAYELALQRDDRLMMARARYKQAAIEYRDANSRFCKKPPETRLLACRYAMVALELARDLRNDRLTARIHTLLGNLLLEFPFASRARATQEWEDAVECMKEHEDFDYVAKRIEELERKLGSSRCNREIPPIFEVTERAFEQPLEKTIQQVEHAIVLALVDLLGPNANAIKDRLQTGRSRIEKHLDKPQRHTKTTVQPPQGQEVIYRVTNTEAFTQPLEETIKAVERAIVLTAFIRLGDEAAVRELLGVHPRRIDRHVPDPEVLLRKK